MLGTFTYHNPTKIYFGPNALEGLANELTKYGPNVVLVYGGGSIKKNGVYDQVAAVLNASGKNVTEIAGVMPNPTVEKLREGVAVAKAASADLILAVGGGSVCDYSKAVSVSANCDEDPWEKYFVRFEEPSCPVVPVGCVLTMAGTGSEMNAGAVITDHAAKLKVGHVFANSDVMPKFSILNPEFTLSLPHRQVVAGIYDAFNHICAVFQRQRRQRERQHRRGPYAQLSRERPHRRERRPELRSAQQHHVGCDLGAEHAHRQRKTHRLDGPHARTGRGGRDRRDSRHDAFRREPSVLSLHHGCRVAEIRAFRDARVGN